MKKKETKQAAKKQQEERLQRQQQQKQQAQRIVKQKQLYLQHRSSPLFQYGLLDAFQFFMVQLTSAGIPQNNIYEFAAQMILKYQKNQKKRKKQSQQIQQFNQKVIKSPKPYKQKKKTANKQTIKPNVLPFKGQLTKEQKNIIQSQQYQEQFQD